MERRYILFFAIALAIMLSSRMLQEWLYPRPVAPAVPETVEGGREDPVAVEPAGPERPETAGNAADHGSLETAPADQPAPRRRFSLGSLDAADPSRLLVTLSSRGAVVERIELADGRFHDQDDRSGYLGHLAPGTAAEGCSIGVVGPGTPAAAAGLRAGDVVVAIADVPTVDPAALAAALAGTKPGQRVAIRFLRDGREGACEATLGRRPLEVVRPEFRGVPAADPDAGRHDPLSFLLSLEARDGRRRPGGPTDEIEGQQLATTDWEAVATDDGRGVRFTRMLPGGLRVMKEYRLVEPAAEGDDAGYALDLLVELEANGGPARVSYALDGPTGLPTEGWWYTQRVWHEFWSSLAVRDVAMRFVGRETALVSGLKTLDGTLDRPATTVGRDSPLSFAGVDALYFAAALLPATGADVPAIAEVRPIVVGRPSAEGEASSAARKKLVNVTPRIVSEDLALEPGRPLRHRYTIFAGPKQPDLLRRFGAEGARMDDLVYYGWFGWVARPMIAILHGLHAVVRNYGIAIILLTVLVRGAMFPVSRRQAISSQKMQALQPEMKVINERYRNDVEKKTRATQELWRKHGVNPASGCLPVFIQIPIFMGLYRALATDVSLRESPLFSSAIRWCSNLAAPDMLWNWSAVLPGFFSNPEGWLGPYLNVLPLVTIGLFLWQQKLFMPPAMDEQQRMQQQVMNYMMWFMALMFFKVPAGLCLYFIASSLWGIAERLLWLPKPAASGPATGAAGGSPASASAGDAAREKRLARKRR